MSQHPLRLYITVWMVTLLLLCFGERDVTYAQEISYPEFPEIPVTLDAKDISSAEAFEAIFRAAGVPLRIEPGARSFAQRKHVSIHADQMPLLYAVDPLLSVPYRTPFRLICRKEKETWVVDLPYVSLDLHQATPLEAFSKLFAGAQADYVFWENAPPKRKVTLTVKNATFTAAFNQIMAQLAGDDGYMAEWRSGVCLVHSAHPIFPVPERRKAGPVLTYRFSGLDAAEAIDVVFRACGVSYVLDGDLHFRFELPRSQSSFSGTITTILAAAKAYMVIHFYQSEKGWYGYIHPRGPYDSS